MFTDQSNLLWSSQEPRQTTSVLGHLQKPSIQALIHGLNRSALNKYDFRFPTNPIYHHYQALLLDRHQLPQDRAGADDADESPQEELDR